MSKIVNYERDMDIILQVTWCLIKYRFSEVLLFIIVILNHTNKENEK
jgi:hypothetical protein